MERQVRAGYGFAVLLIVTGSVLFAAGAVGIIPAPRRPLLIGTDMALGNEPFHLARAAGALPADVTLVEARSGPALLEAVAAGTLDGAALNLDEVLRLEAAGRPMAVLALLSVAREEGGPTIDVLAVRHDRLPARKSTLRGLLKAWYRGTGLLSGGGRYWLDHMARRQGLAEAQLRDGLLHLEFPGPGDSRDTLAPGWATLDQARRRLVDRGFGGPSPDPILDPSYLPE